MSRAGKSLPARYRWAVASRLLAAFGGGYALTSAATVLLALLWPLPKAHAVLAATMLSFTLYAAIILWAVHAPNLWRVWGGIMIATLLTSGLVWWLGAWTLV